MENYAFIAVALTVILALYLIASFAVKKLRQRSIRHLSMFTGSILKTLLDTYRVFVINSDIDTDELLLSNKMFTIRPKFNSNKYQDFTIQYEAFLDYYHFLFHSSATRVVKEALGSRYSDFESINYQIADIFCNLIQIERGKYSLLETNHTGNAYVYGMRDNIWKITKMFLPISKLPQSK